MVARHLGVCICLYFYFTFEISGIFGFLLPVLVADFVGVDYIGPGFGFVITTGGLAASVGTPASGKLELRKLNVTGRLENAYHYLFLDLFIIVLKIYLMYTSFSIIC